MTQQDRTAVQYHKMTETPIPRLITKRKLATFVDVKGDLAWAFLIN